MGKPEETVVITKKYSSEDTSSPRPQAEDSLAWITQHAEHIRLPRPPAVVVRVLEKASKPDCSVDELANVVYQDAVLCGKLLKTVNSSIFGLRHHVASIQQALNLLGLRQIRSLVLSLSLPAIYDQCPPSTTMREYWIKSLSMAIVARELAVWQNRRSPADDLVAGLLCDLGTIILEQARPEQFAKLLVHPPDVLAQKQCELEKEILGITHAELSAHLLKTWRLPEEITEPVRCHHDPRLAGRASPQIAERTFLLYFATQITNLQMTSPSSALRQTALQLARNRFCMDESQLVKFLEPLHKKVEDFAAMLNVKIGACANFAELFASVTQELCRITVETSVDSLRSRQDTPATGLLRLLAAADRLPLKSASMLRHPSPKAASDEATSIPNCGLSGCPDEHPVLMSAEEEINLGDYKIIEVIGRGGMGVVFRAFDTALRRHVAIKVLSPALDATEIHRQRFTREARVAASKNHEHVVTVHAVKETEDLAYLVMEYVDGMSLQEKLESPPPLTVKEIVQIGAEVSEGLAAAHAVDLIHRDIKPANILLKKDSLHAKITDFGLARPVADSGLTQEGSMLGTPQYMAPEQVRGDALDVRADLFSLGGVLYAMCAGEPPFGSDHVMKVFRRITDEDPPSLRQLNRGLSNDLIAIIERLLVKDPNKRLESASETAKLLRRHLRHLF